MARVLVVDDDEDIRLLLTLTLPFSGSFDVVGQAVDGRDALEKADSLRPDLVVMDVMMPGLGGIEATRQMKQRYPSTVVVGFTASGDEGTWAMMDAGATTVVDKAAVGGLSDVLERLVA